MTTTINASPTNGIVQTADGSGVMKLQSNGVTTNALAWVNFNGTGAVAIRSSYNVSSITDNGTGDYTVNFATALSDANYSSVFGTTHNNNSDYAAFVLRVYSGGKLTGSLRVLSTYQAVAVNGLTDVDNVNVAIFGN